MRLHVTALLSSALLGASSLAHGEVPDQPPRPASPSTAKVPSEPDSEPEPEPDSAPASPAPTSPPVATPAPAPTSPPAATPAPAPTSPAPKVKTPISPPVAPPSELQMAGRVGFGLGFDAGPGVGSNSGGINGLFGALADIRFWLTERLVLLPSFRLSVSQTETSLPAEDPEAPPKVYESSYQLFAPSLQAAYAVYRGDRTRFSLAGGASVGYSKSVDAQVPDPAFGVGPKVTEQEILAFNLLAGFHIEQFLTRRMSLVAGVAAPLFAFSSIQTSDEPTSTTISSDLSTTRLYGLFVLYTD